MARPTSIGNLLQQSLNRTGFSEQINAAIVCSQFDKIAIEILGSVAKDRIQAKFVKNKTLTVAVTSSAIGQEIKLHEHEILEKLTKKIGSRVVERLRFLV